MAMAQGLTQKQVKSILDDIDGSTLIDNKTKNILHFSEKVTRNAYNVSEEDMQALCEISCSDEDIFETVAVTSLFNYMDRGRWTWRTCGRLSGNGGADVKRLNGI